MPFSLMVHLSLILRQLDGGNAHETARSRHQTLIVLPAHVLLVRATSAALIPSNASPSVTPSSMRRRRFWVSAMRVYFAVRVAAWRVLRQSRGHEEAARWRRRSR